MLEDERNLITEAKGGEAEAFGRLYDYYLPMIYRFILLKVGHREEAEDLTHQVFLKAWQNMSNYSEKGFPFSSWLYRIAKNSIIDHYRRAKPSTNIDDLVNIEELISRPDIGKIDEKEELAKIMKSIGKLKETEKDVIIMRFVEDLSVKEVSDALNKSEGAVKVIQHRAIKKLQELLQKDN